MNIGMITDDEKPLMAEAVMQYYLGHKTIREIKKELPPQFKSELVLSYAALLPKGLPENSDCSMKLKRETYKILQYKSGDKVYCAKEKFDAIYSILFNNMNKSTAQKEYGVPDRTTGNILTKIAQKVGTNTASLRTFANSSEAAKKIRVEKVKGGKFSCW